MSWRLQAADGAHSLSGQQVRAFIGTQEHELANADIDHFSTFLSAERNVGAELIGPPRPLGRPTKSSQHPGLRRHRAGVLCWHQVAGEGETANLLPNGQTSAVNTEVYRRRRANFVSDT